MTLEMGYHVAGLTQQQGSFNLDSAVLDPTRNQLHHPEPVEELVQVSHHKVRRSKTHMAIMIALTISQGLIGCGEIQTEESSWYRQVRSGRFKQIPFSHDLTLLGYQGWSYVGKLPLAQRSTDVVHVQIWHEVYDGAIEPDLLISHKPKENQKTGSWTAKQRAIRDVRMDVLLTRRMNNGLPKYAYRAVVNGIKLSAELEVPEGSRFELNLIPPTTGEFRMKEPILIGEAIIEGYTQRKGGKTSYTMNRRLFRWFASFDTVRADD